VDAAATFCSGLFGTSSGTTYIESSAGVEAGGRTGMVPAYATAPVLILVGLFMFRSVSGLAAVSIGLLLLEVQWT